MTANTQKEVNYMDIRREGTPEAENELDLSQFDTYQADRIAKATLNFVWAIIHQPGGRQLLEEKKKQLRLEAAAATRKEQIT